MRKPITLYHTVCGKPAFFIEHVAYLAEIPFAGTDILHLDGRRYTDDEQVKCDSCGEAGDRSMFKSGTE